MTEAPDPPAPVAKPTPPPARSPEQAAKAARLASALRDNLRRRKVAHRQPSRPGN
ncbi:hypothetical protein [Brevundimonas sp. NIBR10]|uniref:hypothetical protein n=1 Tax=Brevundimonas sp. NIBR10 TaxID=3015997 RepID=UPI0022F16EAE|nr:hypothetical protein [Brevundimonas sp. NIBR10]